MSPLTAYIPLLRVPRAGRLVAWALLAQLSIAVLDIPLILLVQAQTHSYAVAGVAIALDGVGMALAAPLTGRALDRFGPKRLVPILGCARGGLIAAVWPVAHLAGAAAVLPVVLAAGACVPPVGTAMRLQWRSLLGEGELLQRAYALGTVLGVSLFVIGPTLAAIGISTLGSGATLLISAGLLIAGAGAFGHLAEDARTPAEPAPSPESRRRGGVIRAAGVQTLIASTLVVDAALGVVNVTVPAFAREHGHPGLAGLGLAVFSLAGAIAGTVYGARAWDSPVHRRLILLTAAAAALDVPLIFAPSLGWLVGLLLLAGLPGAAQWTSSSLTLTGVAPARSLAEALSWSGAANAAGVAIGESLAGVIIDASHPRDAFVLAVALLVTGTTLLVLRRRTLVSSAPATVNA